MTDISPRTAASVHGPKPWVLCWRRQPVIALWFTIVVVAYVSTVLIRGFEYGAIGIPANLLLLSGLSVITFGGGRAITRGKVDEVAAKKAAEAAKPEAERLAVEQRIMAASPGIARDLVSDAANKADLGDFQMIVITIPAAVVYIAQIHGFLQTVELRSMVALTDVDNALLASFGLGHGAYLVKKAVGKVNQ